jgi:hypothetical protein
MKLSTLLVAGSLGANVALGAVYLSRLHSAPTPTDASTAAGSHATPDHSVAGGKTASSLPGATADATASVDGKTWASLNTADIHALVARLRAAGFPPAVIRAIVTREINESFKARREQLLPSREDRPFWQTNGPGLNGYDPKYFAAMRDLAREQGKLLKDVLGDDLNAGDTLNDNQRRRFGDLPPDKIEQIQRLNQDYNDLRNEVSMASRGIILPEDRQKLAMLDQERRADLAQILSPQEMEDYLMRTSPTTARLRNTLTAFNATEAEFRAVYQAQQSFDEKYNIQTMGGGFTPELVKERQAAQAQTNEQIKAVLGDERYADYVRASDREFQQLNRLTQQASLPDTAAVQVYNLRDQTFKESGRIYEDPALNGEQKRAALQALGQSARAQITSTLGDDASASYLKVAQRWLNGLERGSAVTLNPNGGVNIRAIPVQRRIANPPPAPVSAPAK